MIIDELSSTHPDWLTVSEEVATVSWRAGQSLADKMSNSSFSDWERVIIARSDNYELMGFCTVTREDGLTNSLITPFIGYVFVEEAYRGNRVSEKLIHHAECYLRGLNFTESYLVSGEVGLYEKYDYQKIRLVETVSGEKEGLYKKDLSI